VSVSFRTWYNSNLETRWSIVPGLVGTFSLAEILLLTAMSVAREKEQGTFDQLLVAPFRPTEIMIGKALSPLLVGLSQATVVLLVALLWFRIPFAGSFLTLYIGITIFFLADGRNRATALVSHSHDAAGTAHVFPHRFAPPTFVRTVHAFE
jgi:ABC-2 type transport system permease protein